MYVQVEELFGLIIWIFLILIGIILQDVTEDISGAVFKLLAMIFGLILAYEYIPFLIEGRAMLLSWWLINITILIHGVVVAMVGKEKLDI